MAQVEIVSEREVGKAWAFEVQVLDDAGGLHKVKLTLSWADYNLWSADGADEPAKVAEAVIAFMVARCGSDHVPAKFDASLARRKFADADIDIPRLISR